MSPPRLVLAIGSWFLLLSHGRGLDARAHVPRLRGFLTIRRLRGGGIFAASSVIALLFCHLGARPGRHRRRHELPRTVATETDLELLVVGFLGPGEGGIWAGWGEEPGEVASLLWSPLCMSNSSCTTSRSFCCRVTRLA